MLIYLAGPYRGDIDDNIEKARDISVELWEMGHYVICPHLNTMHFEQFTDLDNEVYMQGYFNMISRCDAMVMMPNWRESQGAVREFAYAKDIGMQIYEYNDNIPGPHPTEVERPAQSRMFREIIRKMYYTHLSKNADYSPANIKGTGQLGIIVRLWDKMARIMNLSGFRIEISHSEYIHPKDAENESLDDSFLDMAVYSIIGIINKAGQWGK